MAYGLSAWALDQLTRDHTVVGRAWASINGSPFVIPLALRPGGSVKVDGTSPVRRTLSCDVLASVASPTVDPFQAEVRVEYGIRSGIVEEWCTLGTFVLDKAKEVRPGVVHLEGVDRWRRFQDARYEQPLTTSGSIVTAIRSAVETADVRIPTMVVDAAITDRTHSSALWEKDRDKQIQELARSIGGMVYFRPDGTPVLGPIPVVPDIADPGTWQLGRGDGGAKVSSVRGQDRALTYNVAVAQGEPLDGNPGVWAVARDTSASSTGYGGGFGKRTRFMRSRLITTQAQAQDAADGLLDRVSGRAWQVEAVGLPRPDLEYGDSLRIELEPAYWQTHGLQAWQIPLGAGVIKYSTRSSAAEVESET